MGLFIWIVAGQAKRVGNDRHRGECHCRTAEHRRECRTAEQHQQAGGNRNSNQIVDKRPEKILADDLHGLAGQLERIDHRVQVLPHQDDARGFGCHIGAGGEGDAYVGAGASLMPSPTIATILPLFLNSSTALCLSCGSTCARTEEMPA